jgi:hypothetical protein
MIFAIDFKWSRDGLAKKTVPATGVPKRWQGFTGKRNWDAGGWHRFE